MEKYGIGKRFTTNEGYEIEIVEKLENKRIRVRFENGYEVITRCTEIYKGRIKNPYHTYTCGVGYFGVGEYKAKIEGKLTPEYNVWRDMLRRCYDDKSQERCPTYKGTIVCKEWHNFQNFARFYNENHPKIKDVKLDLDKDLLQEAIENKIYSPYTCIFLPHDVNSFLSNKQSSNTSGYIGVSWKKQYKKWRATINLFGEDKQKHLGYFPTPELASEVYKKARVEQAEKVKQYLRDLNYLSDNIIQCIS